MLRGLICTKILPLHILPTSRSPQLNLERRARGMEKCVCYDKVSLYRTSFPYISLLLGQRTRFVKSRFHRNNLTSACNPIQTSTWSVVNLKKKMRPEPAICSHDTAQQKPCFDSCQLTITWMSNNKDVPMVMAILCYFSRYWDMDVCTNIRTVT